MPPLRTIVLFLLFVAGAYAHGMAHGDHSAEVGGFNDTTGGAATNATMSYFRYTKHTGLNISHLTLMILAWVFLLPVAVFLGIARSRYRFPAQYMFHAVNALGLVFGIVYHRITPDLYEHNVHHWFGWTLTALAVAYTVMDHAAIRTKPLIERPLLLLAFAVVTSGFVVNAGVFRSYELWPGVAHYYKGGIFFWYGLLTFARWLGAWENRGWAWNGRRGLTFEFVECAVICAYGGTDVWLERTGTQSPTWLPSDFDHVSIAIAFFGGGLLGLLLEWRQALNPMPALVINVTGFMLGQHKHGSMVSTMLHAQWAACLVIFGMARAVSYICIYLKPGKPPSEIIAAFALSTGGILFMVSCPDHARSIENAGLHATPVLGLVVGITSVLMAWMVVVFAIKDWAKEHDVSGPEGRALLDIEKDHELESEASYDI